MTFAIDLKGHGRGAVATVAVAILLSSSATLSAEPNGHPSFAGTWTLVAADKESADGTRVHEYGEHPKGRMMIDSQGRYSIQIYRPELPNFAANESEPTAAEYRDAMEAASTHYGKISVDWANHVLRIAIDAALYPNLRGSVQTRVFQFDGDVLSYRIPPTPEGIVRISAWRREK
jgi:lipocalin-like protein